MTSAAKPKTARPSLHRKLSVAERAEAATLWRSGSVTLEDLARKFKKRPETFSRLFKKMGIEKGSEVAETEKRLAEEMRSKVVSSVEETLRRIGQIKDENFTMSRALGKMAFGEIARCREAGLPLHTAKDSLIALKIASEVVGNARKELFAILNVEAREKESELDELPELMVRELTSNEVDSLRSTSTDDGLDDDVDISSFEEPL